MSERRVLLIDDNPSDRLIAKAVSEKCNFVVDEAVDGVAALSKLNENFDLLYSLIIVDLQMPKIPGLDLVRRLRKIDRLKSVPILIMSGRNRPVDVQMAVGAGANDYIIKPMDLEILREKIERNTSKVSTTWKSYEVPGDLGRSQMSLLAYIASLNEIGADVRSDFALQVGDSFMLNSELLGNRGLKQILCKVESKSTDKAGPIYKVNFIGLTESDRKKIRLCCRELWVSSKEQAAG